MICMERPPCPRCNKRTWKDGNFWYCFDHGTFEPPRPARVYTNEDRFQSHIRISWSEEEKIYLRENYGKLAMRVIAENLGKRPKGVEYMAMKMGLSREALVAELRAAQERIKELEAQLEDRAS